MSTVSIIIVNWNAGSQLVECLTSIAESPENGLIYEVIVVDNASSDNSVGLLRSWDEGQIDLKIIQNSQNLGFARACNQGAECATGALLLFLNPDTKLMSTSLSSPVAQLMGENGKHVGIVGIQLLDEQGRVARSCARFPSPMGLLGQSLGVDRLLPGVFPPHFMLEWDHGETRRVDQVIGAFFMLRRRVFDILGGFDEQFFVYYEELDFARRAHQIGLETIFLANAQAFHRGEGTTASVKGTRLFYSLSSRIKYARKHFSGPGFLLVLVSATLFEPVARTVFSLAKGRLIDVLQVWQGYRRYYLALPGILRERHG